MLIQYESDHGDINAQKFYNERKKIFTSI